MRDHFQSIAACAPVLRSTNMYIPGVREMLRLIVEAGFLIGP